MTLYKFIRWYYSIQLKRLKMPEMSKEERTEMFLKDPQRIEWYDRMMGRIKRYIHLNDILIQEVKCLENQIRNLKPSELEKQNRLLCQKVKELEKKLSS